MSHVNDCHMSIQLEDGIMAAVDNTNDKEVANKAGIRFRRTARAFDAIFDNWEPCVQIKRGVYRDVMMSSLLYGSQA